MHAFSDLESRKKRERSALGAFERRRSQLDRYTLMILLPFSDWQNASIEVRWHLKYVSLQNRSFKKLS